MLLRRIYCHFCGARSAFGKSSGTRSFQCSSCAAWNYLDKRGEIVDTPLNVAMNGMTASPEAPRSNETFTLPSPESLNHQRESAFCNKCEQNQRIYLETLSSYLPDDDHPQYYEYEKALPKFKADLEKRYPQICRKCAPVAQTRINRADLYAGTQNIAHLSRARAGSTRIRARESWTKRGIRSALDLVGAVSRLIVVLQITWHLYAICNMFVTTYPSRQIGSSVSGLLQCIQDASRLHFHDSCEQIMQQKIPSLLITALCLLWYNPGIKSWYHHTYRMEKVKGQAQYFVLALLMLLVRAYGWYKLSTPAFTESMTMQQLAALHGVLALSLAVSEFRGGRLVKPIVYQHRFKITPTPNEVDIFATTVGPEADQSTPHASSVHPNKLFAKDDPRPFPIWNLAPNQHHHSTRYPSPPISNSTADDEIGDDAMEIDWQAHQQNDRSLQPSTWSTASTGFDRFQTQNRSIYSHESTQPLGWGALRNETFRIQAEAAAEMDRKQKEAEAKSRLKYQPIVEQSPFRGHLPPAPMSMERRLRNPVSQVQFKQTPLSKQQDFLKQMRQGIDVGKGFTTQTKKQNLHLRQASLDDSDEESMYTSAKSRTKGSLDLKKSSWDLPSEKTIATGLEDLFGGNSFSIADEPAILIESDEADHKLAVRRSAMVAVPIALLLLGWNIQPVRRWICLWLISVIDRLGL